MYVDTMRLYQWARRFHVMGVPFIPDILMKAMLVLYTSHVSHKMAVGEGTVLGYGGVGVLMHPETRLGRYCVIAPMVSVSGNPGQTGVADIGDYVLIGIGARIVGPVKIGAFAVIGANAVVTQDVPAGAVMVGAPAREVKRLKDPIANYESVAKGRVDARGRELARHVQEQVPKAEAQRQTTPGPNCIQPGNPSTLTDLFSVTGPGAPVSLNTQDVP